MLLNHKCKHKDKYIKYNMNYKTKLDKQLNVVNRAISRKKENVAQKRQLQLGYYSYYSVHQFNTQIIRIQMLPVIQIEITK